ncbi:FHA domain-containing protein [Aciditerrimonas ferrireducens]|uniref:FHA domain-containing protein n=1 Tax=Aciditerrimonas ferrireducens TaxID=667306 RepID=A0ABV6C5D8_9ACTN
MAFCTNCGHRNPPDANFCASCGAALVTAWADTTTVTIRLEDALADQGGEEAALELPVPSDTGVLVVRHGPSAGTRFVLVAPTTAVGRHPESDIFLDDITVSRRHAEIARDEDGYRIRDLGSLNGTYVNHERIEEAKLRSGDEVQIGKFKLLFVAGPEA